jgi:hypothetical protein
MMDTQANSVRLDGARRNALIAAVIGALGCIAGVLLEPGRFFASYLFAYVFWTSISLGFLGITMLHHMTSGRWSFLIQRISEAGMRVLPLQALLFIPLLFGLGYLYPWVYHAGEEAMAVRSAYLNVPFFIVRAVLYFAIWIGMAYLLNRWSRKQDADADPRLTRSLRLLSAPGMVVYAITATFAAVDWTMSLQPEWFSTIYGMLAVTGQVLAALAVAALVLRMLSASGPLADVVAPRPLTDLGNMIMAFVILWAYMSFSQFLIIWAGNLPDEIPWYLRRLTPGWRMVGLLLIIFHFAVPFLLLLIRRNKQSLRMLAFIAAGILVMRVVDSYWIVMPGAVPSGASVNWTDLAAFLGIGGLWVAWYARQIKGVPLLPQHDPRFAVLSEAAGG